MTQVIYLTVCSWSDSALFAIPSSGHITALKTQSVKFSEELQFLGVLFVRTLQYNLSFFFFPQHINTRFTVKVWIEDRKKEERYTLLNQHLINVDATS